MPYHDENNMNKLKMSYKIDDSLGIRNSNLPTNTSSMHKIFNRNLGGGSLGEKRNPESPFIQMSRDGDSFPSIQVSASKIPEQGVPL